MLSAQKHLAAVSVEALFPFVILARGGGSQKGTPLEFVSTLVFLKGTLSPYTLRLHSNF